MEKQIVRSQRLGEQYIRVQHPTGLTILMCPMEGFSTTYAMFGTKYGSVDTRFKTNQEQTFTEVPEGIAHFLEHKLFESEEGDAFERYAKTGASANAFTSFDRTCYLFTCSENFKESLEILLDFVTHPYFTEETVQKEQGIIGQEIRMYDDNPDWRVYFNLLGALYKNNPVRIDIAGTVDSIAKINAELLYQSYNTFYNLHNMVLTIAGNFDVDVALEVANSILKPAKEMVIESTAPQEPEEVTANHVEVHLPVAVPLFQVGYKGVPSDSKTNLIHSMIDEILLEIITGETSPLYETLYNTGLVNTGFVGEVMCGKDYYCTLFAGESKNPQKVYELLMAEISRLQKEGIPEEDFIRAKKAMYGRYISMYSKAESLASLMTQAHFFGLDMYDIIETIANCAKEQMTARLAGLDNAKSAISIVSAAPVQA